MTFMRQQPALDARVKPFWSSLPAKPPRLLAPITRWHGTSGGNGLLRHAWPTARATESRCLASSPYVRTWPRGISRSDCHTRRWNSLPRIASGRSKT